RSGVAARCAWQGLDQYAPNRHEIGSTTARSVDEVALIRDTISHYSPVLIAPLSILSFTGRALFFLHAAEGLLPDRSFEPPSRALPLLYRASAWDRWRLM